MKSIVFAPATYNLSESTRMLELAKASKKFFKPIFIGYGGKFTHLIREENFPIKELSPRLTDSKVQHLLEVDRMEKRGDFYSVEELSERVKSEVAVFKEIKPAAIVTGFCLSTVISSRVAKVPLVWVLAAGGTRPYYEAGLGT